MILEFLPLIRTGLGKLIRILKPVGAEGFFTHYVHASFQYQQHADCHVHKKGNFKLSSGKRWCKPNFYPTPDQLKSMTRVALMHHRLEKVRYSEGMQSLTFEFSGNCLSPPPGTYQTEPDAVI